MRNFGLQNIFSDPALSSFVKHYLIQMNVTSDSSTGLEYKRIQTRTKKGARETNEQQQIFFKSGVFFRPSQICISYSMHIYLTTIVLDGATI